MDYMTLKEAKADWLIGINATRLFSILYHKTRSEEHTSELQSPQ